jgi:DNA-binding IclR family transcriptional regulator
LNIDKTGDNLIINSVVKTFRLLERVCTSKEPYKLSDLSNALNLSIGATQRITSTLIEIGYLQRDPKNKTYRVTPKILSLRYSPLSFYDIREIALPFMRALNQQINEVVNLAILDNDELLFIERIETTSHSLTTNVRVGTRRPLYCTAMGKVLIAFLPSEEQDAIISRLQLKGFNKNTITDKATLKKQLEKIQIQGFSENQGEYSEGIFALAVPITNHEGRGVAGMNIAIPKSRFNKEKVYREYLPSLLEQGKNISAKLHGK